MHHDRVNTYQQRALEAKEMNMSNKDKVKKDLQELQSIGVSFNMKKALQVLDETNVEDDSYGCMTVSDISDHIVQLSLLK